MPQADSSRDATAANTPSSSIMDKDVEKDGIDVGDVSADYSASERGAADIAEKSANNEEVVPAPPQPQQPAFDPSAFPDGGLKAWTVVAGAFASLFVSFGWINCEWNPSVCPAVKPSFTDTDMNQASACSKNTTKLTNSDNTLRKRLRGSRPPSLA